MNENLEDPMQHLREEHDLVLDVLDRMELAATKLGGPWGEQSVRVLREGLEVLRREVRAHMGLEEQVLYPALARHVPVQTVNAMLDEHRDITWALDRLARDLEMAEPARSEMRWHAIAVVDTMRRHIDKENKVVFMMAAQMLSESEYAALATSLQAKVEDRPRTK